MVGDLNVGGRTLKRAGFMFSDAGAHSGNGIISPQGVAIARSIPLGTRYAGEGMSDDLMNAIASIQRAEFTGDIPSILAQLGMSMKELERGISSGMTAFPVRENLEAEAKILVPLETPVRNKLPRHGGAGLASQWRQATSIGGGWGTTYDQPGGVSAIRSFFAETGAPAEHTTVYANKTAAYKLLGTFGSVTGFAMAAGANFQNQLAIEKTNAIRNLMLENGHAIQ